MSINIKNYIKNYMKERLRPPVAVKANFASLFPAYPLRWIGRLFLIYVTVGIIASATTMVLIIIPGSPIVRLLRIPEINIPPQVEPKHYPQLMTPTEQEDVISYADPQSVQISGRQQVGQGGQFSVGLHKCSVEQHKIVCSFVITALESVREHNYNANTILGPSIILIDNFHIEHRPTRIYYVNGSEQQQQLVNLRANDSIWLIVEFERGSEDIKSVRITSNGITFFGPIE